MAKGASKHVLMLGNGINNLGSQYTWEQLTKELVAEFSKNNASIQVNDQTPFPLTYEELVVQHGRSNPVNERRIQAFIAQKAKAIQDAPLLSEYLGVGFEHILTTNYDHCIENALGNIHNPHRSGDGAIVEAKYSIFRKTDLINRSVWHIHGDADKRDSICIGYDHYAGYLQRMRGYVVNGTGNLYKTEFKPLIKRLDMARTEPLSWLDFFFTRDIHIVGLAMHFMEIHLWWLLAYRARFFSKSGTIKANHIYYYHPTAFEEDNRNRYNLMMHYGINIVSVKGEKDPDEDYYKRVLEKIQRTVNG